MNEKLPIIKDDSLIGKIKKVFRKFIDALFTNHNEGKVVAEILEDGSVVSINEEEIEEAEAKEKNILRGEVTSKVLNEEISLSDEVNSELTKFEESLKVDVSTKNGKSTYDNNLKKQRMEFIHKLEDNPESLIDLSMDRLKKIEEYYDELISELENKLEGSKKVS